MPFGRSTHGLGGCGHKKTSWRASEVEKNITRKPKGANANVKNMDFKYQVDSEKQQQRDWISKLEADEAQIQQDIIDLELAIIKKKEDLVEKRKDLEYERNILRWYDGRKYIRLKCLGFPEDAIKFEIFWGADCKRSRVQIIGSTVSPRAFVFKHIFDLDYEPEEKDIKLEVVDLGKLLVTFNVPQFYKDWHNEELGDYLEGHEWLSKDEWYCIKANDEYDPYAHFKEKENEGGDSGNDSDSGNNNNENKDFGLVTYKDTSIPSEEKILSEMEHAKRIEEQKEEQKE